MRGLSRRSVRQRTGQVLVEGPQGVREAVRFVADQIRDLYVTPDADARYREIIDSARAQDVYVHVASEEVIAAMCDADSPQGMVAVVQWEPRAIRQILASRPRLLVVLAQVRDPGNLGTVIRGADAAGADAVLITEGSVDVTSPKVIRSTAGSLFHLPVVTGLDLADSLRLLTEAGVRPLAADGSGERTVHELDLSGPHAWVMGNEAWGLDAPTLQACDEVVRVPIHGHAESLNLAMAATICLYSSAGQQRA